MLTKQDIDKIVEAEKNVFPTKEDFDSFKNEIKGDFSNLVTSVDKYATKSDAYFQEMLMLSHKLDKHEQWIHQIAKKLGIELEY